MQRVKKTIRCMLIFTLAFILVTMAAGCSQNTAKDQETAKVQESQDKQQKEQEAKEQQEKEETEEQKKREQAEQEAREQAQQQAAMKQQEEEKAAREAAQEQTTVQAQEQPDKGQEQKEAQGQESEKTVSQSNTDPIMQMVDPDSDLMGEEYSAVPSTNTGGHTVVIDAGHQAKGNSEQEPIGPGASTTKPKVASGTSGSVSGLSEYELTLAVSLKLRDELKARGYQVVMVRETHDVDISNAERAAIANASGDIFLRIHANGSDDSSVSGALTMAPSSNNPYVSNISSQCQKLSEDILQAFCQATGAKNRGVSITDSMSGINWCTIPVTIVEMGFMSNPTEDASMASEDYQNAMVNGIANGVDTYFAQ